ncbi:MAG: hypothetical protein BWY06_03286 [Candidatus Latescibacteria bacterium ADurb.Bin168]|nr:MAG: hypothetical protein BWY06_03286 [Candidatus Latescibacteria bacterium ADurb.Bin168]
MRKHHYRRRPVRKIAEDDLIGIDPFFRGKALLRVGECVPVPFQQVAAGTVVGHGAVLVRDDVRVTGEVVLDEIGAVHKMIEGRCNAVDGTSSVNRASSGKNSRAECVAGLIMAARHAFDAARQPQFVGHGIRDLSHQSA